MMFDDDDVDDDDDDDMFTLQSAAFYISTPLRQHINHSFATI